MAGMAGPAKKALTILWSALIAGLLIALAGSVLLPSTKRSRLTPEQLQQFAANARRYEERAATRAATRSTTAPAEAAP